MTADEKKIATAAIDAAFSSALVQLYTVLSSAHDDEGAVGRFRVGMTRHIATRRFALKSIDGLQMQPE